MDMREWRTIGDEFSPYRVSDDGWVERIGMQRVTQGTPATPGHLQVRIHGRLRQVHRLVCFMTHYFVATKPLDPPAAKVYPDFWSYLHEQNGLRLRMEAAAQKKRRHRRWT